MPRTLTPRETRPLRLRGQRLLPSVAASSVAEVAGAVVGLQAQSWPAAVLGVRPRSSGLTAADVDHAREAERSVLRSWFMRGTLHLVATEDAGWLLGLLGPGAIAADDRRRRELGLDEATYADGVRALEAFLADGPRTRAEIEQALIARGAAIRPKTQALIHLLQRAALEGRVCYGPHVGREQTFVLLRDWADIGRPLDPDVALVEFARRFLAAFAPASVGDFAKWSRLPMPLCRRAFAALSEELAEVEAWGASACIPRRALNALTELEAAEPSVSFLGAFDTYLIGYQDRRQIVAHERHYGRVWNGGLISPVVTVGGEVVATWKLERKARETLVRVTPLEPLDPALSPRIEAEAADIGRFLGVPARLVVEPSAGS